MSGIKIPRCRMCKDLMVRAKKNRKYCKDCRIIREKIQNKKDYRARKARGYYIK